MSIEIIPEPEDGPDALDGYESVICDTCGTRRSTVEDQHGSGWVYAGSYDDIGVWHFCSQVCLAKAAETDRLKARAVVYDELHR